MYKNALYTQVLMLLLLLFFKITSSNFQKMFIKASSFFFCLNTLILTVTIPFIRSWPSKILIFGYLVFFVYGGWEMSGARGGGGGGATKRDSWGAYHFRHTFLFYSFSSPWFSLFHTHSFINHIIYPMVQSLNPSVTGWRKQTRLHLHEVAASQFFIDLQTNPNTK